MAQYKTKAPNGEEVVFTIRGDTPDDYEQQKISERLQQHAAFWGDKPAPPPTPPEPELGAFGAAFKGTGSRIRMGLATAFQEAGAPETAKSFKDEADRINADVARRYKPKFGSFDEVKDIGDFGTYAYENVIAPSIPEAIAPAVGGILGGVLSGGNPIGAAAGAVAFGTPGFMGSNAEARMEQGQKFEDIKATDLLAPSAAQSLLNVWVPGKYVVGPLAKLIFRGAGEATVKAATNTLLQKGVNFSGRALRAMVEESGAEGAQQAIEIYQANPERFMKLPPDVQAEIKESMIGGAIGGALLGGLGSGIPKAKPGPSDEDKRNAFDESEKQNAAVVNPIIEENRQIRESYQQAVAAGPMADLPDIPGDIDTPAYTPTTSEMKYRPEAISTPEGNIVGFRVVGPEGFSMPGMDRLASMDDARRNAALLNETKPLPASIQETEPVIPLSSLTPEYAEELRKKRFEAGVKTPEGKTSLDEIAHFLGQAAYVAERAKISDPFKDPMRGPKPFDFKRFYPDPVPPPAPTPKAAKAPKPPKAPKAAAPAPAATAAPVAPAVVMPDQSGQIAMPDKTGQIAMPDGTKVEAKAPVVPEVEPETDLNNLSDEETAAYLNQDVDQEPEGAPPKPWREPTSYDYLDESRRGGRGGQGAGASAPRSPSVTGEAPRFSVEPVDVSVGEDLGDSGPFEVYVDGKKQGTFPKRDAAQKNAALMRERKPSSNVVVRPKNRAYAVHENLGGNKVRVDRMFRDKAEAQKHADERNNLTSDRKQAEAKRQAAIKRYEDLIAVRREAIKKLYERLKQLGAPKLALRFRELLSMNETDFVEEVLSARAEGYTEGYIDKPARMIGLSLDIYSPDLTVDQLAAELTEVLNHEFFHVLQYSNAFSVSEWAAMVKYVKTKQYVDPSGRTVPGITWYERAKLLYQRGDKETDAQYENKLQKEAMAEAFRAWARNPTAVTGQTAGLFRRVMNIIKALFGYMKNDPAVEKIFQSVEAGQRKSDWQGEGSIGEAFAEKNLSKRGDTSKRFVMKVMDKTGQLNRDDQFYMVNQWYKGRSVDQAIQLWRERKLETEGEDKELSQRSTPAFRSWFGKSKVVGSDGQPLRMYTGTSKDTDFRAFRVPKNGVWFTSSPDEASSYAMQNDSMGYDRSQFPKFVKTNMASRVIPVYLRIENPYTFTEADQQSLNEFPDTRDTGMAYKRWQANFFDKLRAQGYDGVDMGGGNWVVLKDPTQIKSATSNNGNFSPANKNIDQSVRGVQPASFFNARSIRNWAKISGEYGDAANIVLVKMPPQDFIDLATPGARDRSYYKTFGEKAERGMAFGDIPELGVKKQGDGTFKIYLHEGRHRSNAMKLLDYPYIPVILRGAEASKLIDARENFSIQAQASDDEVVANWEKLTPTELETHLTKPVRVTLGLAPDQTRIGAEQTAEDTIAAGKDVDAVTALKEVMLPIQEAAVAKGATVYNSPGVGMYSSEPAEISTAFAAIYPPDTSFDDIIPVAAEAFKVAKAHGQRDAFVAIERGPDYEGPDARPAIQLWFNTRAGAANEISKYEKARELLNKIKTDNVAGFSMMMPQQSRNLREGWEGVTFVWVPEYNPYLTPEGLESNYRDTLLELADIVEAVNGGLKEYGVVASVNQTKYSLLLGSQEGPDAYDKAIEDLLDARRRSEDTGGRGTWGKPVGDSFAARYSDQKAREANAGGSAPDGPVPGELKELSYRKGSDKPLQKKAVGNPRPPLKGKDDVKFVYVNAGDNRPKGLFYEQKREQAEAEQERIRQEALKEAQQAEERAKKFANRRILPDLTVTKELSVRGRALIETSGLVNASNIAKKEAWPTGRDFKLFIQDEVLKSAEELGIDLKDFNDPRTIAYVNDVALSDGLISLSENPNAIGWYDEKTKLALKLIAMIHPEIEYDEQAKFAFIYALAATSNGQKVNKNFDYALQAYEGYKATRGSNSPGNFPTNLQAGKSQAAINKALKMFNILSERWGPETFRKFCLSQFTVGELQAIHPSLKPGGEDVDVVVRGAALMGAKIGNGFFSNLYGHFGALTMDRWLVRTWGRWTGDLVGRTQKQIDASTERFPRVLKALTPEERNYILEKTGVPFPSEAPTWDEMADYATKFSGVLADKDLRTEIGARLGNGKDTNWSLFRKATNTLAGVVDGQKEIPDNGGERKRIRAFFQTALDTLRLDPRYAELTMADLQAVVWYAEKRLYAHFKETYDEDGELIDKKTGKKKADKIDIEPPDYVTAAEKAVKAHKRRPTDKAIEKVKADARRERDRDKAARARAPNARAVAQDEADSGGFTSEEREAFVRLETQQTQATVARLKAAAKAAGMPAKEIKKIVPYELSVRGITAPLAINESDIKRVGSKPGGSAEGYLGEFQGNKYLIKFYDEDGQAAQEVLASILYRMADVAAPIMSFVNSPRGLGVASKWVKGSPIDPRSKADIAGVREGFGVDAWLANWDTVGLEYDNVLKTESGYMRVDPGGSLDYRAQGDLKGSRFGNKVIEIDGLRNPTINPQAATIYKGMTNDEIGKSINRVAQVSDEDITAMVETVLGQVQPEVVEELAAKMVKRKHFLLAWQAQFAPDSITKMDLSIRGITPEIVRASEKVSDFRYPDNVTSPEAFKKWWTGEWRQGIEPVQRWNMTLDKDSFGKSGAQSLVRYKSGAPKPMYHGTGQIDREFLKKVESEGLDYKQQWEAALKHPLGFTKMGSSFLLGNFLSPRPQFAETYAGIVDMHRENEASNWTAPRMYKVYVSAQNVFDISKPEHLKLFIDHEMKAQGINPLGSYAKDVEREFNRASKYARIWREFNRELTERVGEDWEAVTNPSGTYLMKDIGYSGDLAELNNWHIIERITGVRSFFKNNGFDSYYILEEGVRNIAVLNGEAIKSVHNTFEEDAHLSKELSARGTRKAGSSSRPLTAAEIRNVEDRLRYTKVKQGLKAGLMLGGIGMSDPSAETASNWFIDKFQDSTMALGEIIDKVRDMKGSIPDAFDAYLKMQLWSSVATDHLNKLHDQLYKPMYNVIKGIKVDDKDLAELKKVSPMLAKVVEDATNQRAGFISALLYARHAPERNALIRVRDPKNLTGSGISTAEANAALAWFQRHAEWKKMSIAEGMARKIVDETNNIRVEYGLTPDYRNMNPGEDFIKAGLPNGFRYYVPLRGIIDEDQAPDDTDIQRLRTGLGMKIKGKEDMTTLGRDKLAGHVLEHLILQNEVAVARAHKNEVGNSFYRLVQANAKDLKDFAEIVQRAPVRRVLDRTTKTVKLVPTHNYKNDPNYFVTKVDGDDVVIHIKSPRLAQVLNGKTGHGDETTAAIMNFAASVTRTLSRLATGLNPEFWLKNTPRDLIAANINIQQYEIDGLSADLTKNWPSAAAAAGRANRNGWDYLKSGEESVIQPTDPIDIMYQEFLREGGFTGYMGLHDLESRIGDINAHITEGEGSGLQKGWNTIKRVGAFVESYNNVLENATRFAVYKSLRDRGMSAERSAQAAKTVTTNFNAGGEYKNVMNSLYMFFNASLQGTFGILTGAFRSARVRKIIGGIMVYGMVQDMLMSMVSGDDEDGRKEYDKIPDHVLENFLVFPDPFGFSGLPYMKIPMPFGFNGVFNFGRVLSKYARHQATGGDQTIGKTVDSAVMTLVDSVNPLGGTNSFLNFAMPTVLDPVVDLTRNKNFAESMIAKRPLGMGVDMPSSQLHLNSTSPTFVNIAEFLNSVTGGTDVMPGAIDFSPDVMQYLFQYFGSGAGAFVQRSVDFGLYSLPDLLRGDIDNISLNEVPFVRSVIANDYERTTVSEFIDIRDKVLLVGKEVQDAAMKQDAERLASARETYAKELSIYGVVKGANAQRQAIVKRIAAINNNDKLTAEAKESLIKPLKERELLVQRNAIRAYSQNVLGMQPKAPVP
jgi:hypothetical protein